MNNLLWALLVLAVGCTQPTYYTGPAPLPTEETAACPSFTSTTTVTWSRPDAWTGAKLGISKNGRAPFIPILNETKVPSGYFGHIIDANGEPLPFGSQGCTEAQTYLSIPKCKNGKVRVVDEEGRGLPRVSVAYSFGAEYYRYGYTDPDGYLSACFFHLGENHVHGPDVVLKRRKGQTFIMRPAQHQIVTVVDEERQPLSGVEVTVRPGISPAMVKLQGDRNGVVQLEVDPAGLEGAIIYFRRPGYATTIYGHKKLGTMVTLRPARIVHVKTTIPKSLWLRDATCGTFKRDRPYECKEIAKIAVCECPIGPATLFVDYHSFAIPADSNAATVDLSTARNGIRGKIRGWQASCKLRSRRAGTGAEVVVNEDGTFAHPALAPSLKYWLELKCPDGNRRIEHSRLGWQWLDLGEI